MLIDSWKIYFASIASIQHHPANPPDKIMPLEDMAKIADEMVKIEEKRRCLDGEQQ